MRHMEKQGRLCDPCRFRQPHMTFWPKCHPALILHGHTDHWSKMKTRVPYPLPSVPVAAGMEKGLFTGRFSPHLSVGAKGQSLPSLVSDKISPWNPILSGASKQNCGSVRPQNLPKYRNEYNDRARRGFRYWPIENRVPKYYGYSLGAYKTLLGLPRV